MSEKYCDIGGQALIEGVMMRGKTTIAMSVRKPDGDIETKVEMVHSIFSKAFFKWPIVRGMVALINAMIIGVQALTYSAEFFMTEEELENPSKFDQWVTKVFKDKAEGILIFVSLVMALGMALLMFAVIPAVLAGFLKSTVTHPTLLSLIEGLIKVGLFVGYILLISQMKDIQRVFQYHGAEHKTIHCYESGQILTPENAQRFSRIHPRCGTSFLLFVMAISIALFSLITWQSILTRILLKILLMPVVAGLAFELIKLSAKYDNGFMRAISMPGLWMQRLTTKEPTLDQIAVAITAMERVLQEESPQVCEVKAVSAEACEV